MMIHLVLHNIFVFPGYYSHPKLKAMLKANEVYIWEIVQIAKRLKKREESGQDNKSCSVRGGLFNLAKQGRTRNKVEMLKHIRLEYQGARKVSFTACLCS